MKALKIVVIIIVSLAVIAVVGYNIMLSQTKKHSPEVTTTKTINGVQLSINYSSPSKKGRDIFGALVPYNEVWRTGANEPTTFTCSDDVVINGKTLSAGEYSLWTIPNKDYWTVIFNSNIPGWGVDFNQKAQHEAEFDVIKIEVPVQKSEKLNESFVIDFKENPKTTLYLAWDMDFVEVPIRL